jgi:hypothetical protein
VTRQRTAFCVLVAYIVTGLLVEVTHHDAVALSLGSHPVVASHECGAHEVHIPLDRLHPCLACFQASHRVSTPASSFILDAEFSICQTAIPFPDEQFHPADYLFTGKRGPPLS